MYINYERKSSTIDLYNSKYFMNKNKRNSEAKC